MDDGLVEVEAVEKDPLLSELSTQWTMLFQANHGTPEQMSDALRIMMLRYEGAVHRYLLKAVGDPEVVRELDQEFALRFLKGKFLKYDPRLGRFRDYVKRAVRNLMMDHHRRQAKTRRLDTDYDQAVIADSSVDEIDEQIITAWRDELLDRTWNALEDLEKRTGQPHHTILKYRARHPDLNSDEMARGLADVLGKSLSSSALRNRLQHAREKWVGLLVDEVKASLRTPSREQVEEELAELRLLHYCKPVMARLNFDLGPN
ncbi:MAG: RNA polymerase sigma factor [Isosphaeraceae bacterium]